MFITLCFSPSPGDTELFSKSLKIQAKRFYVDVKQNRRGKFIKIAEVSRETMKMQLPASRKDTRTFAQAKPRRGF